MQNNHLTIRTTGDPQRQQMWFAATSNYSTYIYENYKKVKKFAPDGMLIQSHNMRHKLSWCAEWDQWMTDCFSKVWWVNNMLMLTMLVF